MTDTPPTDRPLTAGDAEIIERGLRTIRTYDAVRFLRDALSATTARMTGYDWNADPDGITKQQGDAFSIADRVFADLKAAVAATPEIDLPECQTCGGTGKIEGAAKTEGANQHSACVRLCDDCDGCGFAPDAEELAHVSRPATSAASEGEEDEGDPELPDTPEARTIFKHFCDVHGLHPDEAADSTGSLLADLATLASPPVSERERELEGALREARQNLIDCGDHFGAGRVADALTAQPQEPV